MPVVPINSDYSNVSEFVNSLFAPDVRTADPVEAAIAAGDLVAEFSDEIAKIPPVWLAAWQASQGDPYDQQQYGYCKPADRQAFAFLGAYIKQNSLSIYVPQLGLVSAPKGGPPVYQLQGYQESALIAGGAWDYGAVSSLLEYFLHGAHFVVVQQDRDLPPSGRVADFYQAFHDGPLSSGERRDPGNSHYTGHDLPNWCGLYFPSVDQDTAPADPTPFVLAWLVGSTVRTLDCSTSSANSFFQLEGWQAVTARHSADYASYEATLWNISTYGACAFSEKRGTAIFLAPTGWAPLPNGSTIMPPYAGADPIQPWLNTGLVQLQDSAPLAVVRVSNSGGSGPFSLSPPSDARGLIWSLQNADGGGITYTVLGGGGLGGVSDGMKTKVLPKGSDYQISNPRGYQNSGDFFNVVVTWF